MTISDWKMLGRMTLGVGVFGIGALVALMALVALIDPVGTKMADDANPFGKPEIAVSLVLLVAGCGALVVGGWLARPSRTGLFLPKLRKRS
jgi:hypothetical protein